MKDRIEVVVLAVVLLALVIGAVLTSRRPPDDVAIVECVSGYQRARTSQDSAIVDARTPITSRAQAGAAVDCRTLRLAGRLAHD